MLQKPYLPSCPQHIMLHLMKPLVSVPFHIQFSTLSPAMNVTWISLSKFSLSWIRDGRCYGQKYVTTSNMRKDKLRNMSVLALQPATAMNVDSAADNKALCKNT